MIEIMDFFSPSFYAFLWLCLVDMKCALIAHKDRKGDFARFNGNSNDT